MEYPGEAVLPQKGETPIREACLDEDFTRATSNYGQSSEVEPFREDGLWFGDRDHSIRERRACNGMDNFQKNFWRLFPNLSIFFFAKGKIRCCKAND